MKYYKTLLWIAYVLSAISLLIGIILKFSGCLFLGLEAISYARFTGICLLYVIALNLTEMSLTPKQQ